MTFNGWKFTLENKAEYPFSVFKNISHNGYDFAKEILINKIILNIKGTDKHGNKYPEKTLLIEPSQLEMLNEKEMDIIAKKEINSNERKLNLKNFNGYKGVGVVYFAKIRNQKVLFNPSVSNEPVFFCFSLKFADTNNNPPHEFSGLLLASRITPVFRFYTENKDVQSVRVDYKFAFNIQNSLTPNSTKDLQTYCAITRDGDTFPDFIINQVKLFNAILARYSDSEFDKLLKTYSINNTHYTTISSTSYIFIPNISNIKLNNDYIDFDLKFEIKKADGWPLNGTKHFQIEIKNRNKNLFFIKNISEFSYFTAKDLAEKISSKISDYLKVKYPNYNKVINSSLVFITNYCLSVLVIEIINVYKQRLDVLIKKYLSFIENDAIPFLTNNVVPYVDKIAQKKFSDIIELISVIITTPILFIKINEIYKLKDDFLYLMGIMLSVVGFSSIEKPVFEEVVGQFVKLLNISDYSKIPTWDNLHYWGTKELPSAPGAFFAIHSHFRWGNTIHMPDEDEEMTHEFLNEYLGTKRPNEGTKNMKENSIQFRSSIEAFKNNKISGPLIDNDIPKQIIEFAITKNGSPLFKRISNQSEKSSFESIANSFDKDNINPENLATIKEDPNDNEGADTICWLSCCAYRRVEQDIASFIEQDTASFKGNFLINGFYFPHVIEYEFSLTDVSNAFAATRGVSVHKPVIDKNLYYRNAKKE